MSVVCAVLEGHFYFADVWSKSLLVILIFAIRSRWRLKRGLFGLFLLFVMVPFSLKMFPDLIQHVVYTHRRKWILFLPLRSTVDISIVSSTSVLLLSAVRVPFFVDLSQPAHFSLNHTINMYLTSEEGISLGVWLVQSWFIFVFWHGCIKGL